MTNAKYAALALAMGVALVIVGCDRTTIVNPTAPNPTPTATPTPGSPGSNLTTVAFRATGNPTSVRLRYSTPADGVAQVVTSLPFDDGFTTAAATLFLSLEGTPISYGQTSFPFFSIEIVVNDAVFRQATSADFLFTTLAIEGTFRR